MNKSISLLNRLDELFSNTDSQKLRPANAFERTQFGSSALVHHKFADGKRQSSNIVKRSTDHNNGYEHHSIDYHTSGPNTGMVRNRSVTTFNNRNNAIRFAHKQMNVKVPRSNTPNLADAGTSTLLNGLNPI